jgi:hypothetical protein
LAKLKHGSNRFQRIEPSAEGSTFSKQEAAEKLKVSLSSVERASYLDRNGASNIIELASNGEIGLQTAAHAIKGASKAEQANWTAEDVQRRGSYAEYQRDRRAKIKQQTRVITPPYRRWEPLTREERGLPKDRHAQKAHIERYGRTPLYPPAVHDLLEMKQQCVIVATAIRGVATGHGVTPENLFENITRMLAWIRQPEKKHGQQIDFARAARELRADLRRNVPRAIAYLQSVADWLESEGNGRGQEDRSEAGKGEAFRLFKAKKFALTGE